MAGSIPVRGSIYIMRFTMTTLHIVRGLPGSGKSTFAKTLNCLHLEADMFFNQNNVYRFNPKLLHLAHHWCLEKTKEALSHRDVVVSNTFTTIKELKQYLELDADIKIYEMTGAYGSIHNVPEETLSKMKARWQEVPEGYSVTKI